MSEEGEREEIKDETHHIQDEEQEELDEAEEEEEELNEKKATAIIAQIFPLISLQRNTSFMVSCIFYHHPLINPIVNPADILLVNGI
jgi:hypothetical protein